MKTFGALARALVLTSLVAAGAAEASPLYSFDGSLVSTDPTQLGRLSRNGQPQDWGLSETFPGVVNPGTTYHYHAYSFAIGATPYVQVMIDSNSGTTFLSAYRTSYDPALGLDVNWLGDAGFSGNLFGTDPISFQVVVDPFSTLVLVVNESLTDGGLGMPYDILVEGFIDTEYTDPPADVVPEPSTLALWMIPLVGLAAARGRRRKAKASSERASA